MSDVDVIVLDLDGGAMLQDCLASIAGQSLLPARVVVFDNGSRSPVTDRVSAGCTGTVPLEVVRSEENLGFAGGVNAALLHTSAPLLALVNNDVVLDGDWLETLRGAMGTRDGALQTILRRDDTTIDGAGIDVSAGTFRQAGHGAPIGTPCDAWGVSATATLYRRELLRFDERFFAYYEDVELCARIHDAGFATRVVPVPKATHRGSASAGKLGARARFLRTRNRYYVSRLHPGVGSIKALLAEDLRLLVRGRSSVRGIIAGLASVPGPR